MIFILEHPVHGMTIRKRGMSIVILYKHQRRPYSEHSCNRAEEKGQFKGGNDKRKEKRSKFVMRGKRWTGEKKQADR